MHALFVHDVLDIVNNYDWYVIAIDNEDDDNVILDITTTMYIHSLSKCTVYLLDIIEGAEPEPVDWQAG